MDKGQGSRPRCGTQAGEVLTSPHTQKTCPSPGPSNTVGDKPAAPQPGDLIGQIWDWSDRDQGKRKRGFYT